MSEDSDYVSRKDVARRLGMMIKGKPYTERALINWELRGYGPPVTRVGRDVVYYWPSVLRWLKSLEGQ